MRESNFAFPAQNRACVCITSQLYDRRALDTTSPLPLFNSLTHLTYLTSTSPRIREIMTMDGGLERLVRILHDFCMCPPPPDNPALIYGLSPPNSRPPKLVPTLNPASFDRHAAYRFSLAFQCVVNIGVRGSEPIRSRVVQAGTLEVVGCILEAWLANKGFAVGPSSSATGLPRETREQRQARRQAQQELRQREEAAELDRALQRSIHFQREDRNHDNDAMSVSPGTSASRLSDTEASTDNSTTATPLGSNTPTASVIVTSRDRSGTIIARTVWDDMTNQPPVARTRTHRPILHRDNSGSPSDTSRPDTETEDDGDVEMETDATARRRQGQGRRMSIRNRIVGIASDDEPVPAPIQVNADAHIIINDAPDDVRGEDGGVAVDDGLVSLEPNNDFAMGAPPGAPGAIEDLNTPRTLNRRGTIIAGPAGAPDVTPRAGIATLPMVNDGRVGAGTQGAPGGAHSRSGTIRATRSGTAITATDAIQATATITPAPRMAGRTSSSGYHHHRDTSAETGPYRDEDVLLSLQLLAYLSKYPHVRQAFYKPCLTFHPASANLPTPASASTSSRTGPNGKSVGSSSSDPSRDASSSSSITPSFLKSFASSARGKDKTPVIPPYCGPSSSSTSSSTSSNTSTSTSPAPNTNANSASASLPPASSSSTSAASTSPPQAPPPRQTNVFSLVERFTFRPSSSESDLPNPPPKLPVEIQYWAGVIMRNACRKDDSRGGIRQCANMLCGRWESYPREFAKCRRCRKAKYCGKECQSTAWSEGHRFWCSAKDGDDDNAGSGTGDPHTGGGGGGGSHRHHYDRDRDRDHHPSSRGGNLAPSSASTMSLNGSGSVPNGTVDDAGGTSTSAASRRDRHEARERERAMALAGIALTLRNVSNGQALLNNPLAAMLTGTDGSPVASPTAITTPTATFTQTDAVSSPSAASALGSRTVQLQIPQVPIRGGRPTAAEQAALLRQYRDLLTVSGHHTGSVSGPQQVPIASVADGGGGARYGWSSFMAQNQTQQGQGQQDRLSAHHYARQRQQAQQHQLQHHARRRAETITGTPSISMTGQQAAQYRSGHVATGENNTRYPLHPPASPTTHSALSSSTSSVPRASGTFSSSMPTSPGLVIESPGGRRVSPMVDNDMVLG